MIHGTDNKYINTIYKLGRGPLNATWRSACGQLVVGWIPVVPRYHILYAAAWGTIVAGGIGDESFLYFISNIKVFYLSQSRCKGKGKVLSRIGQEGPEGGGVDV